MSGKIIFRHIRGRIIPVIDRGLTQKKLNASPMEALGVSLKKNFHDWNKRATQGHSGEFQRMAFKNKKLSGQLLDKAIKALLKKGKS